MSKMWAEAERATRYKDDFIATMSLNLRTPLFNAILGWSQVLKTGTLDAGEMAEAINTIERNATHQEKTASLAADDCELTSGKIR